MLQSTMLTDNEVLPTLLPGQNLTVFLKNGGVVVGGVQTAANVTQANILASKVLKRCSPTPHTPKADLCRHVCDMLCIPS